MVLELVDETQSVYYFSEKVNIFLNAEKQLYLAWKVFATG